MCIIEYRRESAMSNCTSIFIITKRRVRMKKITAFFLALVLGLTLVSFASCGSDDEVELVFAWWGGDFRAEQTHQVIELFLAQTDNVVYIEPIINGFGDHWTALDIRAAANDLPDIMQHDVAHLLRYVEAGHLVDLTPFMNDGRIDVRNIPQTTIDQGRIPGRPGVYALPIGLNVVAMIYNKSLLDELGLEARRNMTMNEFIDLAREIYARSGVRTNWGVHVTHDPFIQMEIHLRAQGINLFEGTSLGGTWENYVEYFEVIQLGLQEGWHITAEDMMGRDGAAMNAMWYPPGAENAHMRVWNSPVWSNMINGYIADSPPDMEISMTTHPSSNPQRSSFGRASMYLAITTHSDHQDEAAEFISFWLNSVPAHEIMLGERGFIVNTAVASAVYDQLPLGGQKQSEFVAWTNAGNSAPFNPLRPDGAGEALSILRTIVEEFMHGLLTPEEAAQRFFTEGNAVLR